VIQSSAAAAGTGPRVDIIMCDTSYSDMKAEDNRGKAASEVRLMTSDDL
jgi:hypothetical protein